MHDPRIQRSVYSNSVEVKVNMHVVCILIFARLVVHA